MGKKVIIYSIILLLSGCSVWNDEFDEPVPRAMPKASIHKISTLIDDGTIKEDEDSTISRPQSARRSLFTDGNISRGFENISRVHLTSYEDSEKNLHAAHYLYVVIKSASWITGDSK
jgi:hypothetical protein